MRGRNPILSLLVSLAALTLLPTTVNAQTITSNQVDVNLTASVVTELTIDVSPTTVDFSPIDVIGITSGSPQLTVTTTWNLPTNFFITWCAYFDSASAALTDGAGGDIPTSDVEGKVNAGSFAPFTTTCNNGLGVAGASFNRQVCLTDSTCLTTDSDISTMDLQIDRTGDALLPSGNYTGTLHFQAGAQ